MLERFIIKGLSSGAVTGTCGSGGCQHFGGRRRQRLGIAVLAELRSTPGHHLPEAPGEQLAIREQERIDRGMQDHAGAEPVMLGQAPEMRPDLHIAVPGEKRTRAAE
ncbi:MAG: hypothetical protein ACREE5_10875, partial [Acetobacteraceae bacterium]